MHPDEVPADGALVRRLLAGQFPRWADLQIAFIESYGTDHHIYRLGDHLAVRMPRIGWATKQAAMEATWLPKRRIDATGAHPRPPHARGGPLAEGDEQVRRSIAELGDRIDGEHALRSWQESLDAPAWDREEVWVHGDLLPGNLLVVDGRLSAVIDFGGLNVGDPACDLQPAWNVFAGESRARFRAELEVEGASWLRGRGWALYQAVSALPYYWETNSGMVRQATHALTEVRSEG